MPRTGTRPTTDRVREALFNLLEARLDFDGIAVLDLYAGSGALGLEALSRGAASAVLVESDARAAAVIAENIKALGVPGATVRRGAVAPVLGTPTQLVDLVFADPPYEVSNTEVESVLSALVGWLNPDAVVIVERAATGTELTWPAGYVPMPSRKYGDTRIELGCYEGAPEQP